MDKNSGSVSNSLPTTLDLSSETEQITDNLLRCHHWEENSQMQQFNGQRVYDHSLGSKEPFRGLS